MKNTSYGYGLWRWTGGGVVAEKVVYGDNINKHIFKKNRQEKTTEHKILEA